MKERIKKNIEPKLRNYLLEGKTITHNQAQKRWGTNRLSEYIRRLREDGMKISTEMVYENGDCYGVYKMVTKPKVDRIASRQYMEQA